MQLNHHEFKLIQALFLKHSGIVLAASKKQLVICRLAKRLHFYRFDSFYQYYNLIKQQTPDDEELSQFIHQLTTHETLFFREPKHFVFLAELIGLNFNRQQPLRIWSAACSTGQEPYSIAMTVAEHINHPHWQIIASDLSTDVLDQAKSRCFDESDSLSIPPGYRVNYCLKGIGSKRQQMKIKKPLAAKINFANINLTGELPEMAKFDLIFLRNVLIYFDQPTKHRIVNRLLAKLKCRGYLLLGHAESLLDHKRLKMVQPTIYQLQSEHA